MRTLTKEEMLKDIKKMLGVHIEWHDGQSCLFDLRSALVLANKYEVKLDIRGLRSSDFKTDYDLTSGDVARIVKNQKFA